MLFGKCTTVAASLDPFEAKRSPLVRKLPTLPACPQTNPSCQRPRFQDYNGGSAPFPYATECTLEAAAAACDPSALVAELEFPESAVPVDLGISAAIGNGDESADAGVGLVSACRRTCFDPAIISRLRGIQRNTCLTGMVSCQECEWVDGSCCESNT